MRWIKFLAMMLMQMPISVFYYLEPTNPIYFIIYQFIATLFIFMIDNAVSVNINNINSLNHNFEKLLENILKAAPSFKDSKDMEGDI